MKPALSAFLDVLRLTASLVVFTNHCAQYWARRFITFTGPCAHGAVIAFFVFSGYVIAYATLGRKSSAKRFIAGRLSRLYSVVVPALLLTWILQGVGNALDHTFYSQFRHSRESIHYLITACFLQNVWLLSASPSTNAPFWSLSYEFWYYALFGITVFVRAGAIRNCALIVVAFVAGPNILLLMPCWLLGLVLFTHGEQLQLKLTWPKLAFALSLVSLFAAVFIEPLPLIPGSRGLWYSGGFLTDWVIAMCVGLTLLTFNATYAPSPTTRQAAIVRGAADHTFSIYLYHYPLVIFAAAAIPFDHSNVWQLIAVALGILGVVVALGYLTESKRLLWQGWIESACDLVTRRRPLPT